MEHNLLLLIALILVVLPSQGHTIDGEGEPSPSIKQCIQAEHTCKAPLYWSVYEYCWLKERAGEGILTSLNNSGIQSLIGWQ
ncbi:hypothetical protein HMPREF0971_01793 [Segatella oris F0302]|uniref:Uncharacterized protein n=1 Tax=Segatella oris F0302 TaxID=649760 RepID=D1QS37_9BACT|nr:hypothetical protein [Segatella oris]EFB32044.1 hypothetical protein HMPREF0971_01793 [Segatella oris F0302]